MNDNSTMKLEQLTGLRFFAALLVFVSHLSWNNSTNFFKTIFSSGYVGVSFFFVLSGFVLSYSYQKRICTGEITFLKYIYLRIARLTPLHFATTLPFIGLAVYFENLNVFTLLANLSYLQSWIPNDSVYFSFNSPSWSLSNEMFFYLCFFSLATLSLVKLLRIALSLAILIIICATVVTIFFEGVNFFGSKTTVAHWMFYIFPGFRILEFICGMILFNIWKSSKITCNSIFLKIIAYFILFLAMYFARLIPEAFRMSLFFLPVIILFLFTHLSGEGLINRFFKSKVMVLLGNASFAFYLIHQPLIHIYKKILIRFNFSDLSDFKFFLISLIATTMLSIAVYLIYEKWAERKLKQLAVRI